MTETNTERHPKWQRVEPGTMIPAGQPYRIEYTNARTAYEATHGGETESKVPISTDPASGDWFVDSSWKPPLVLPAARSLILAEVDDRYTEDKVLLIGPHTDKGNTWWSFDTRLSLIPDEINSFEVLWTEGERGKDALVPWEAIEKLKEAYPNEPGAYMSPVDFFLREVVGDR